MPATGGPTNGNMELAQALAGPSQGAAPPPAPQGGFVSPSPPAARNNPGNLRPLPNGQMWQGQTGVAGGFDTFGTPEAGDRAATINLQNQERLHGLNTISQIVAKWAPKGDGANDPAAYAATVGRMTGIDPNQPIDLNDPATLQKVKGALYTVEQGHPVQGSAFAQSSPPSGPQSTSSGEQSPPTPRSLQIATGGSVSIPSPEANGPVGASPFAVQPQAPVGPANAPPRPAGPPTGPQATPQEIAIYQAGMRAPPGSPAYMQAMQLAHQIQQRASQPIAAPDREHWDAQQGRYVPLPGAGYQQIAAGPNGGVQADPFGKRDAYSNPNVGALGPNQVSNADGSVSNRPVEQQQTFKIPGANGVFVNGPDGRPMKVADDAFSVKDLGDRLTKLQGSDQYKAADNAVNMYTAATQAAQRPGGISDVELRDFAARQFSGGVARQFNVEALNNAQGAWANLKQFAPELISGQHMSPAARSALLQAMHDDAVQAQTSFQHLSASDEAFAQAQGTSLAPYLSPLARQLPPMPSLGQIPNGSQLPPSPGQPQAQQPGPQLPAGWPHGLDPNKQDGQAALALIQQHGYRFQNGQLVK